MGFKEGPPGWVLAFLLTMTVLISWWMGVLGWGNAMEMYDSGGGDFLTYSAAVIGLWLGYKVIKARADAEAMLPLDDTDDDDAAPEEDEDI